MMNTKQDNKETIVKKEIERLQNEIKTLILSTQDKHHKIETSYTPYVFHDGCYYILISTLAPHGRNLRDNPDLNILLIEDEACAKNIFARTRLTYTAIATVVERSNNEFEEVATLLKERAGKTVNVLLGLSDFSLYKVETQSGRLIIGFGQAYLLDHQNNTITHVDRDLAVQAKEAEG